MSTAAQTAPAPAIRVENLSFFYGRFQGLRACRSSTAASRA